MQTTSFMRTGQARGGDLPITIEKRAGETLRSWRTKCAIVNTALRREMGTGLTCRPHGGQALVRERPPVCSGGLLRSASNRPFCFGWRGPDEGGGRSRPSPSTKVGVRSGGGEARIVSSLTERVVAPSLRRFDQEAPHLERYGGGTAYRRLSELSILLAGSGVV